MGQLALYLLALRANCRLAEGHKEDRLVSRLKRFLEEERKAIGEETPSVRVGELGDWRWSPSHPPFCPTPLLPRRGCCLIQHFLNPTCDILLASPDTWLP